MIWYVLIFVFCILIFFIYSSTKNKNTKIVLEIITLIILIIFSGTRYRLGGYDYGIYEKMFNSVPKINEFVFNIKNSYGTDILYYMFNSIVKTMGFNFYGFTLIESIIFHILLYRALKKYKIDFSFFIVIFLYKLYIFNTFVSMRQSLVLVIFFNAVEYIIENKKIKYILLILLCTLIHTSSIILLPLVFVKNIHFSKKGLIIYCMIFLIFFVLNLSHIYQFNPQGIINKVFSDNISIMSKSSMYFNTSVEINIFSTLECYGICMLLIIFYDKLKICEDDEKNVIINLFLILVPILTFFRSFEVAIRLRDYFSLFIPFVLYYILKILKNKEKVLYIFTICALCFIGYYRYIITYGGISEYNSYLTKEISIFIEKTY